MAHAAIAPPITATAANMINKTRRRISPASCFLPTAFPPSASCPLPSEPSLTVGLLTLPPASCLLPSVHIQGITINLVFVFFRALDRFFELLFQQALAILH